MSDKDINEQGRRKPHHTRLVLTCDNELPDDDSIVIEMEGSPRILVEEMSCSLALLVERIASTVLKSDGTAEGKEELKNNEEYLLRLITGGALAIINSENKEAN